MDADSHLGVTHFFLPPQGRLKKPPANNNCYMDGKIHAPATNLLYKLNIRIAWLYTIRAYLKTFCQIPQLYVLMV